METAGPMSEAYRMIFEDERSQRLKAEAELKNAMGFIKLLEQQLFQAREERDRFKKICEAQC